MKNDDEVPYDEITKVYTRMKASLGGDTDARIVICACLLLIAECNVALGVKPTGIDDFLRTVAPLIQESMEAFGRKEF